MNSEALPPKRKRHKGPSMEENPDDTHQFLQQYLDSLPPLQNLTKKKRKRKRKPSLTEEDIKKNLDAVNNSLSDLLPVAYPPTDDTCGVAVDSGLMNEASNRTGVAPLRNRRNRRKQIASPTKEDIKKNLDALKDSLSDLIPAPYWPWYQKIALVNPALRSDMKPLLSVLHGKAHSWPCQIFWGARWQNGAGLTTGENVEQVNSYLSRYTNTTKYMTAAGREETLTEGVLFWNKRKIYSLAQMLRTWYDKTLQKEKQLLAEFEKLLDTYGQQDMDHITRELVAYAAEKLNRPDAARAQAITLEEKLELAVSAVAERKRILSQTGDTSKRRHKIRLKLDKDKAVLRKLLVDYNGLHPEAQCTEADIAAEVYPWHDNNENNDISIVAKRKLGEAHLGISRTREELGHLLSEMRQYLEFYRARLAEAQRQVIFLESNEDDNVLLPSSEIDTRYVCGKLTKWTRDGALVLAKLNLKYQKRQLELGMEYLNLCHPREEDAEENENINNEDISDSDMSDSEI